MRLRRLCIMICASSLSMHSASGEPFQQPQNYISTVNHTFTTGEKLTYAISWSKILDAGIAVMEVKDGPTMDGRHTYQFVSSTRSVGIVEQFYPIREIVESVVDARELYSITFMLDESLGSETSFPKIKKRKRIITFDHKHNTALFLLNYDTPETYAIAKHVQDALSSLYYVRTRTDFTVDKPIIVDVFDSGKTWTVEIYTLGRERISTPAGAFDTIRVKTYPKYEGVFMNKGEIFIWITDDEKKIPVLMKSTIMIGSIVATLTKIELGKINYDVKKRTQPAQ